MEEWYQWQEKERCKREKVEQQKLEEIFEVNRPDEMPELRQPDPSKPPSLLDMPFMPSKPLVWGTKLGTMPAE